MNKKLREAWEIYLSEITSAQGNYHKIIAPALEIYDKQVDEGKNVIEAWKAFEKVAKPEWEAYKKVTKPAWEIFKKVLEEE